MLNRKKAAKKASIASFVKGAAAAGAGGGGERRPRRAGRVGGAGADRSAIEDPDFDRAALLRAVGDDVNTRLQDIAAEEELDPDVFDQRRLALAEEAQLVAGTRQRVVSDAVAAHLRGAGAEQPVLRVRHNSNAVTAVASLGGTVVVFGDKTGKVFLVDLGRAAAGGGGGGGGGQRLHKTMLEPPLPAAVTAIAVSDTRQHRSSAREMFEKTTVDMSCPSYVAVGAADGSISVWETLTRRHRGLLSMHRQAVTGLSFRQLSATLYSCSDDGTLRVWSVPSMMAVDKLYGHEGRVAALHGLRRETCASVGDDGTMRFWKMDAATQQAYDFLLEHREPSGADAAGAAGAGARKPCRIPLEAVAMVSETLVVAGGADGSLVLFDVNRRRPAAVVPAAHGRGFTGDGTGLESAAPAATAAPPVPNPITALAAAPYTDVVASAGYDGVVRLWRVSGGSAAAGQKSSRGGGGEATLELLAEVPLVPPALVTSLSFAPDASSLLVANSKEPRRGRWVTLRAALNSVTVVPLTAERAAALAAMPRDVEHVPAQLFGFVDGDEEEEEAEENEEEEEEQEGERESAAHAPDAVDEDEELVAGGRRRPLAGAGGGSALFSIGPDGQLVMAAPPQPPATSLSPPQPPAVTKRGHTGDVAPSKKKKKPSALVGKKRPEKSSSSGGGGSDDVMMLAAAKGSATRTTSKPSPSGKKRAEAAPAKQTVKTKAKKAMAGKTLRKASKAKRE